MILFIFVMNYYGIEGCYAVLNTIEWDAQKVPNILLFKECETDVMLDSILNRPSYLRMNKKSFSLNIFRFLE